MSTWRRFWLALFGPYIGIRTEDTEFLLQRGYYGEVLITAIAKIDDTIDDKLGIQIRLNGQQAAEFAKWMQRTGGTINKPAKDNIIRFPTSKE